MTRDGYFELCELMGDEPLEENIPVEFEDFCAEVQQAFHVYGLLRDEWDTFNGIYLGKSLIGITEMLDVSQVEPEDRPVIISLVKTIDRIRQTEANKQQNNKPAK